MTNVAPVIAELTITEFRDNLGPNLDKVQHRGAYLVLSRKERKAVALIPMDAFEFLRDAEYAASYAASLLNTSLDELGALLFDMTNQLGQPTVELAGGDAAAIALVLAEYRAAHTDTAHLCAVIDMLLRRLGAVSCRAVSSARHPTTWCEST
jgi:PHD/YefM family antitoxin component YafN of YafNO toxin-antitoxin module